jgi:hypothetical protein
VPSGASLTPGSMGLIFSAHDEPTRLPLQMLDDFGPRIRTDPGELALDVADKIADHLLGHCALADLGKGPQALT